MSLITNLLLTCLIWPFLPPKVVLITWPASAPTPSITSGSLSCKGYIRKDYHYVLKNSEIFHVSIQAYKVQHNASILGQELIYSSRTKSSTNKHTEIPGAIAYSVIILVHPVSQSHLKHLSPKPVNWTWWSLEAICSPGTAYSPMS